MKSTTSIIKADKKYAPILIKVNIESHKIQSLMLVFFLGELYQYVFPMIDSLRRWLKYSRSSCCATLKCKIAIGSNFKHALILHVIWDSVSWSFALCSLSKPSFRSKASQRGGESPITLCHYDVQSYIMQSDVSVTKLFLRWTYVTVGQIHDFYSTVFDLSCAHIL